MCKASDGRNENCVDGRGAPSTSQEGQSDRIFQVLRTLGMDMLVNNAGFSCRPDPSE
jgi:hypothetical protein